MHMYVCSRACTYVHSPKLPGNHCHTNHHKQHDDHHSNESTNHNRNLVLGDGDSGSFRETEIKEQ